MCVSHSLVHPLSAAHFTFLRCFYLQTHKTAITEPVPGLGLGNAGMMSQQTEILPWLSSRSFERFSASYLSIFLLFVFSFCFSPLLRVFFPPLFPFTCRVLLLCLLSNMPPFVNRLFFSLSRACTYCRFPHRFLWQDQRAPWYCPCQSLHHCCSLPFNAGATRRGSFHSERRSFCEPTVVFCPSGNGQTKPHSARGDIALDSHPQRGSRLPQPKRT